MADNDKAVTSSKAVKASGGDEVKVTLETLAARPEPDVEPVKGDRLVKDDSGIIRDASISDPQDIIRDAGRNTMQSPRPRYQTDPGAEDPMTRGAGEAPGPTPQEKGEKMYVLQRPFYDGRAYHKRGEVMPFVEGEQPRTARPVEGKLPK